MFDVRIASKTRVLHYSAETREDIGWEVKVEEDCAVRQRKVYEDWHRVERSVARMEREVATLLRCGWTRLS